MGMNGVEWWIVALVHNRAHHQHRQHPTYTYVNPTPKALERNKTAGGELTAHIRNRYGFRIGSSFPLPFRESHLQEFADGWLDRRGKSSNSQPRSMLSITNHIVQLVSEAEVDIISIYTVQKFSHVCRKSNPSLLRYSCIQFRLNLLGIDQWIKVIDCIFRL